MIVEKYFRRNTFRVFFDRREILSELFSIVEQYSRSNYLGVILDRRVIWVWVIMSVWFSNVEKYTQSVSLSSRDNLGVILSVILDRREILTELFSIVEK